MSRIESDSHCIGQNRVHVCRDFYLTASAWDKMFCCSISVMYIYISILTLRRCLDDIHCIAQNMVCRVLNLTVIAWDKMGNATDI